MSTQVIAPAEARYSACLTSSRDSENGQKPAPNAESIDFALSASLELPTQPAFALAAPQFGQLAQRLEHLVYTQGVGSSNLSLPTSTNQIPSDVKSIRISRGFIALVSPQDYPSLARYSWNSLQARNTVYAVRWENDADGTRKCLYMHRQIMGEPESLIDHWDRDGLHNWRENLRCATSSQNVVNSGPRAGRPFKGVFAYGKNGKYRAMIAVAGKIIHLGCRDFPEDAARLYDAAALRHFGSFAYLNFPQPSN